MFLKALRREYLHFAVLNLLGSDDTQNAAVMVNVRVGIKYCLYGECAEVFGYEFVCRLCTFHRHQRVIYDPACIALDERDVRHIIAAHLIDAVRYLEKSADVVELCVAPKARVCGIRSVFVKECISSLAPYDISCFVGDFEMIFRRDKAAGSVVEFSLVVKVEQSINLVVLVLCVGRSRLGFGVQSEVFLNFGFRCGSGLLGGCFRRFGGLGRSFRSGGRCCRCGGRSGGR